MLAFTDQKLLQSKGMSREPAQWFWMINIQSFGLHGEMWSSSRPIELVIEWKCLRSCKNHDYTLHHDSFNKREWAIRYGAPSTERKTTLECCLITDWIMMWIIRTNEPKWSACFAYDWWTSSLVGIRSMRSLQNYLITKVRQWVCRTDRAWYGQPACAALLH
jgi:hypothetical protein